MYFVYRVLLLHDQQQGSCRIKEYLELSEYFVEENGVEPDINYERLIQHKHLILISCEDAGEYFSLCERLRYLTEIPIVFLTKNDDEWIKIKMFQIGADDYVVEPCNNGELVARLKVRIEQYLRLTRTFGIIRSKDLVIEVFNRKVYVKNQEVELTIREFDILLYLAQHANMVVAKEDLVRAIWLEKYVEGGYNSIAAFVKKIRRKLDPESEGKQYIETIWGIGYRFIS